MTYQPGSNDITLAGNMKVNTGALTKIYKFEARFHPTEAREQNGLKIETVVGSYSVGSVLGAGFEYNVNGTLESHKGEKTLSLQGVQCEGNNIDPSKKVYCNY